MTETDSYQLLSFSAPKTLLSIYNTSAKPKATMPSTAPANLIQNQTEAQPAPQEPMVAQTGIETTQPVRSLSLPTIGLPLFQITQGRSMTFCTSHDMILTTLTR